MHRAAAAMGEMNLGHFIPDYTAYEELLSAFKGFIPIPILLDAAHGYRASRRLLLKEIVGRNPTGPGPRPCGVGRRSPATTTAPSSWTSNP